MSIYKSVVLDNRESHPLETYTSSIHNTTDRIDKGIACQPVIDKPSKLRQVIPPINIVRLDRVDPIEETGDPLEFLVFLAPAYDFGITTKINVGIATVPSFGEGSFAQEVVEFAEVAYSAGLDYSSTPPADVDTYIKGTTCQFLTVSLFTANCTLMDGNSPTTLDIGPTRRVRIRLVIHCLTRLLTLVHIARNWRIGPWIIAFEPVIPIT